MMTIPLAGMSTDIYIPSLPALAAHFTVIKALTQYTVTSYVFAMALTQLLAGPISDALGRKKLLLSALFLQVISILVVLHSPNIICMIIARFFQGLGAAFMIVPARAILNDIFTGDQLKKHFNYLTISFAVGPIVAPFIGGYMQHYIGWEANFYAILFYGLILLILYTLTYRETLQDIHPFSIHKFRKNYKIIFSNPYFVIGSILLGMLVGYSCLFNVVGTFIIQVALHKSSIIYGRVALLLGLGWFLGNTFNRLTFDMNKSLKIQLAFWVIFLSSIAMFILGVLNYFNLYTIVVPIFIMVMMAGIIFANYVSECLGLFPRLAASTNGSLFAIAWAVYALYTYIATLIKIHSLLPLAIAYLIFTVICLLIYYLVLRRWKFESAAP